MIKILSYLILFIGASVLSRPNYEPQILSHVERFIIETKASGEIPIVIFDLDDTLMNARSRTFKILLELTKDPDFTFEFPSETQKLSKILERQVKYHLEDTLKDALKELTVKEMFNIKADFFWKSRFFSNSYCADDKLIPGSNIYVRKLHALGAKIVYLTGRDVTDMSHCTNLSLDRNDFPVHDRTSLILKPRKDLSDTEFKKSVFESLKTGGKVVACFENEPANLNAMKEAFPDSIAVFLDTAHSNKPDVPDKRAFWIEHFEN